MSSVSIPSQFRSHVTGAELACIKKGKKQRAVIHIDVDCYEAQLWTKKQRDWELPFSRNALVITNPDGVILSINHVAKTKFGIRRNMTKKELEDAKKAHPNLIIRQTGLRHNRCDTLTPIIESDRILAAVMEILNNAEDVPVERSSVDGLFIEVGKPLRDGQIKFPENNMVRWLPRAGKTMGRKLYRGQKKCFLEARDGSYSGDRLLDHPVWKRLMLNEPTKSNQEELLLRAGALAYYLLEVIENWTGYACSAGVGPNRLLAKIACGMNKPQGLTMLTSGGFQRLAGELRYTELDGLKSNTGGRLAKFYRRWSGGEQLNFIAQLRQLPLGTLIEFYKSTRYARRAEEFARKLFQSIRGLDERPVEHKLFYDRMGITHSFKGDKALQTWSELRKAFENFAAAVWERLEYAVMTQGRWPRELVVTFEIGCAPITKHGEVAEKSSCRIRLDDDDFGDAEINSEYICKKLLEHADEEGYWVRLKDILRVRVRGDKMTPVSSNLEEQPFWMRYMLIEWE